MQLSLALDPCPPVAVLRARLLSAFGSFADGPRLAPVDQLVAAMISSRTRDEVSWPAYQRLKALFRSWDALAEAEPEAVGQAIAHVTHAEIKAGWLPEALRRIVVRTGSLSLDFLADMPVDEAMAWLQALPGVGDKTAAATLNFSTLRRPVMVVETHVWRVARRIGLAPRNAEPAAVRETIMAGAPTGWDADDFFELHWLLKRLGQTLCQDQRTRCGACPVAVLCAARGQAARAPLRPAAVVRPAFGGDGNKK